MTTHKRSCTIICCICILFFCHNLIKADQYKQAISLISANQITNPQQNYIITGTVTDENGEAVIGANISVKGATRGIITDIDGNYSIEVSSGETLIVTYIGYLSQEIKIDKQTRIDVKLTESLLALDEVVVVGYGTMRKQDLTGSIGTMRASKYEDEKPKNIQDLLRGNIAGLNIGMTTSAKGGGDLLVRGKRTLKASATPLLVLDGVIYNGSLDDVNPNDIESIDVLKDASSAAVYGAKSANGVVIINTKKGTLGKPAIGVNVGIGIADLFRSADVYEGEKFIDWRSDVLQSINRNAPAYVFRDPRKLPSGVSLDEWKAYDGSTGDEMNIWLRRIGMSQPERENYVKGQTTDWKDMVFRTALQQNYNVSVSGKSDKVTYYWSMGYTNNEGVIEKDDYSIFRSRLRLEADVANFLAVGLNTLLSYRMENGGGGVAWSQIEKLSPYGQPTNPDGSYKIYPTDDAVAAKHPLIDREFTQRDYTYKSLDNTLFAKLTLPFGISYEFNYSPRITNNDLYIYQSAEHPEYANDGGIATRTPSSTFLWQIDNILRWKHTFKTDHNVDVTLLANAEKNQTWEQSMTGKQFVPSDVLGYHNMGSATVVAIRSTDSYSTGDAYMGRLFYSYKSKYLFTGTIRRDGYSAFGTSNPRATFPSIALGWVFTNESFINQAEWLNYGKLRLSWGSNGNRSIGIYDALSSMQNGMITYMSSNGTLYQESYLNSNRMSNQFLKWEKTESYNIGFDLSFLNERLNANLDVYTMNTNDLLVDRSLPNITGYASVASNLGEINNKGFEITLYSNNIDTENFSWRTSFNYSMNRNKIKSLYGDRVDVYDTNGDVIGQKEADDIANKWFIGHATDEIWDYKVDGVWQAGEEEEAAKYKLAPGDFKLRDVDGDGQFTNDDKVFQGYTTPRFRWSMRNEFNFLKHFDFSFSMYSYWGHKRVFNQAKHNPTMTLERFNSYVLPYWTPENKQNDFARLNSNMAGVTFDVHQDMSFVRLDNITLGYNVSQALLSNYKISRLKLTLSARNVAVWTKKFVLWDPEYSGPTPSYVTFGLNLSM
ncbi:MAG: SusC/RagA family TonB-linked outer membrane protein [Tannerella sp.]|nr:SusC/RagA family TonB-linked outer membrane protein [Tannerella sp.]